MQTVAITGVSSGIGLGAATVFTRQGCLVFGTVRSTADGERLQAALGPRFTPLVCDVTDHASLRAAAAVVAAQLDGAGLDGLINNAGIALSGPLMHQPLAEVERHFAGNVTGLLAVTQAFLPLLGAGGETGRRPGQIINISSVGGRIASPFIGAYAASKQGSDVAAAYAHTDYAAPLARFAAYAVQLERGGYPPERFGRLLWRVFVTPRPRPRYTFAPNRLVSWTIPRLLPAGWLDRLIGRNFGLINDQRQRAAQRPM